MLRYATALHASYLNRFIKTNDSEVFWNQSIIYVKYHRENQVFYMKPITHGTLLWITIKFRIIFGIIKCAARCGVNFLIDIVKTRKFSLISRLELKTQGNLSKAWKICSLWTHKDRMCAESAAPIHKIFSYGWTAISAKIILDFVSFNLHWASI